MSRCEKICDGYGHFSLNCFLFEQKLKTVKVQDFGINQGMVYLLIIEKFKILGDCLHVEKLKKYTEFEDL
ncbi:MAG: hypothetical protein ACPGJV_10860 [Bacteriovoracaceae bacterium]